MNEMLAKVNAHAAAAAREANRKAKKARRKRNVCRVLDVLILFSISAVMVSFCAAGWMAPAVACVLALGFAAGGFALAGYYVGRA